MNAKILFLNYNVSQDVSFGAGLIVSTLLWKQYDVKYFEPLCGGSPSLKGWKPDIVMGSSMSLTVDLMLSDMKEIKEQFGKNIPVLIGGIGPTTQPSRCNLPWIDGVFIGEGESIIADTVELILQRRKEMAPYRINGALADLSNLVPFRWGIFPDNFICKDGRANIWASRGCKYNCTYCVNSTYLKMYKDYVRTRPWQNVIGDMRTLMKQYNAEYFYFVDEMLFSKEGYAEILFSAIKEHINKPYGCMIRAEVVNKELIELLKKTGCVYLGMGVECGDEEFRKKHLNRWVSNDVIKNAFSLAKENGIFTTSYNMVGYPFPWDNSLTVETIALTEEIKPDYAQFSIFYPFAGTKLGNHCIENNLILADIPLPLNYYEFSVLKEKENIQNLIQGLNRRFNPNGFTFKH